MRLALIGIVIVLAALAAPGFAAAGPGLLVGAVEDDVRASSAVEAEAKMSAFRLSGFRALRITSFWLPGQSSPDDEELQTLRVVAEAAQRHGVRLYVTVMHPGSRTTPLTDQARGEFASFAATIVRSSPAIRDVIVGNEPNLNRFWLPQFELDGSSAAPRDYIALLARVYDALKAVSADVRVHGGAVSPRGTDRPNGIRPTHSPTTFIQGMGAAYRASARTRPVMDTLVIHPYGDNSSQPPATAHPNSTNIGIGDYPKLVALLAAAFDGTAQRGATLPIVYGEYGVETAIPADKASLYTGDEPTTTRPVDEATQAAYYEQALALSFCQPTVETFLIFHARDERSRPGWQSGLDFVDGTPKSSKPRVTRALNRAAGGSIARCPGIQLPVRATYLRFGTRSAAKRGVFRVSFRCELDCRWWVRLENAATRSTKLAARGSATVGELVQATLQPRPLARGTYRYTLRLVHPVNPAAPTTRQGPRFRLP